MKAVIIFAHPNPASFNAAILATVQQTLADAGVETEVRDLYALGFNPVFTGQELGSVFTGQGSFADAKAEQAYVAGADLLVFIHPIWWFSAPAIIKGYVDRILTNGFAFQLSPTGPLPLMRGKKAFIVQTGGNTLAAYEAYNLTGVPQGVLEKGTLQFTGFTTKALTFLNVQGVTQADRQQMLSDVANELTGFIGVPELA